MFSYYYDTSHNIDLTTEGDSLSTVVCKRFYFDPYLLFQILCGRNGHIKHVTSGIGWRLTPIAWVISKCTGMSVG